VNPLYLITGLLSMGLFFYIVAALLRPEWF